MGVGEGLVKDRPGEGEGEVNQVLGELEKIFKGENFFLDLVQIVSEINQLKGSVLNLIPEVNRDISSGETGERARKSVEMLVGSLETIFSGLNRVLAPLEEGGASLPESFQVFITAREKIQQAVRLLKSYLK